MKKLVNSVLLITLMLFATTAYALTIDYPSPGIEVGEKDTLLAWAELDNSGDQTEENFINSVLGPGYVVDYYKDDDMGEDYPGINPWVVTNENITTYAYDFGLIETSYFLIKTGNIVPIRYFLIFFFN